jgi:replication factor A1
MVDAIIGDAAGTARMVAWAPDLLLVVPAGAAIHITGAKPNQRDEGRSYSLDEKSTVTITDQVISIPFTPLGSVADQGVYSVQGTIRQLQQPRSFTTRNGTPSWVRNVTITDGKDDQKIVLWGENALVPLAAGDSIEVYHATAKPGRFGDIELAVGRGSALRVPKEPEAPVPIVFSGTIIAGQGCTFIDNGKDRYLIEGNFPEGSEVEVTGTLSGSRIIPGEVVPVVISTETVLAHVKALMDTINR